MSSFEIVEQFSSRIKNERTPQSTMNHLRSEVEELDLEVSGDSRYGLLNEGCDVINCVLDLLFQRIPDLTEAEFDAVMIEKCEKWEQKYTGKTYA